MHTIAHRIKSPLQNNADFLCSLTCFAYFLLHGNNYGGNATMEVNFTTSSILKLQFCYLDDIEIRMIITVITSSTSCYTTSSNLKVDLQLPANRALPLRVDVRSWCSTSANDKWRSTVSEKTRYRKLFTLCALKHFNRAVFGPLKSQRNVDPQTGAIVFLRTTMHHSSDDAVFLHQCLNRSSYLSEFIQFSV